MKWLAQMRIKILTVILLVLLVSACLPRSRKETSSIAKVPISVSTPSMTAGIGVLGDSTSDEYRADDARGGEYGETTLNWVELLVRNRGLNFGQWGSWEEPRRAGYEYNWARTGATIDSMITSGQVAGLAQQVAERKVSYVFIWIGNNDFHLKNGPYEEIYNGKLNDAELQKRIDHLAANIEYAMDTILQAGDVKMAIVTIADQGVAPQAKILFPNAQKRQRVTEAVNKLNARIQEFAQERGVLVLDSNAVGKVLFSRVNWEGKLTFSDQKITVLTKGNEPHHLQLEDNIGHAGTVLSGIIANSLFIEPFDDAFGLHIQLLTDEEILHNAGLQ